MRVICGLTGSLFDIAVGDGAYLMRVGPVLDTADLQGQRSKVCDVVIGGDLKEVSDASSASLDQLVLACLREIKAHRALSVDMEYKMPRTANNYKGELSGCSVTLTEALPEVKSSPRPDSSRNR